MTIDSEKNIVTGKDIYIEDAKKDFLSNVNFIGDTTQKTEDPIQWKEAQGNDLHLTDISLTEVKDFNVLGDSKQEEIEAVEGKSIEGEYITVTDADLSKEFSLEYLGNSKQEQREGYNLFDAINSYPETHTKTGITFTKNSDGTFNAHGTATSDTPIGLATGIMGYLVAGEEYSLYSSVPYNSNTFNLSLTYGGEGMTNKYLLANSTKTLDTTTQWATLNLYIPSGQTINVDNVKVMICKGAYDSSKPFEQYGATPSIEIPSEIENVKAYNLFDKNAVINNKYIDATGSEIANNQWVITDYIEVDSNSNYTYFGLTSVGNTPYSAFYDSNKTFINSFKQKIGKNIIEVPENAKYIRFSLINNKNFNGADDKETFIFYQGIENKSYAPFGAISIGLENKNTFKVNNTIIQNNFGLNYIIDNNKININGTSANANWPSLVIYADGTSKKSQFFPIESDIDINKGFFNENTISLSVKSEGTSSSNTYTIILGYDTGLTENITKVTINDIYTKIIENKKINFISIGVSQNISVNLDFEIQIEEGNKTTELVTHQEQNYNLHIGDLELNGIGDIRDSFVVEVDNSYSYKKVKNLYLKKKFIIYSFNGTENWLMNYGQGMFHLAIANPLYSTTIKDIALSNYYKFNIAKVTLFDSLKNGEFAMQNEYHAIYFKQTDITSIESWKLKLQELYAQGNPLKVLYPLETPELIDLTDDYPELVEDIENIINNMKLYEETTYLYTSGNLVIKLDYNYITPSPSINRPSEIENLTGDIDIINANKNLYNYKDTVEVNSSYSTDEEGWITVTYDNTEGSTTVYLNYYTNNLNLKPNTNYNIIAEIKNVTGNGTLTLFSNIENAGQFSTNNHIEFTNLTNNSVIQKNATTKESLENVTYGIRTYAGFTSGQSGSITFRISVLEDTTITADTFSYVPFLNQTYPLHLGDLELNGLGDIRDSFVVELDNSYSNKKINNLYLNKKLYKHIFTGEETIFVPTTPVDEGVKCYRIDLPKAFLNSYVKALSNVCKFLTNSEEWISATNKTDIAVLARAGQLYCFYWRVSEKVIPNTDYLPTYFQNNEISIIYPLETPELIDLTETYPQLVEDIENILNNIELYEDVTNIYIDGLGEIYIKYDGYDGTPALKNPSEVFNITGEQTVTITNTNKFNLLNYQLPGTIYEKNGITFIMNNDGTIDLYGYANEDAEWYLVGGVDKNYDTIMSFDSEYTLQLYENKDSNVFIYLMNDSKVIAMTNLKDNFSYNGDIDTIMIRVNKGTTVDTTIYPILTEETEQEAEEREEDYTKANQQLYKIRLKDLELNGDNNVRDTFEIEFTQDDTGFKNITKLYHNKNFNKYIFTGEENVTLQRIQNGIARFDISNIFNNKVNSMLGIYCNYLKNNITETENTIRSGLDNFISTCVIYIDQNIANNAESLKIYLKRLYDEGNPMYVIYQLANTEKVLIQDEDLIQDLENLLNAITYEGVNKIKSTATVVIEYTVKYKDNYDFYIDENDKFFCVPQYGIKFLFSPMESNIPEIAEATESTVKIRNKDGDLVLSTTYEPISLDIVCYTDENLDAKQKIAEISKVTRFLDSIKYKTKKIALLSSERMFPVKYNKNLTPTRYPKSIRFSIPLKSSKSYSNVLYPTKIFGNGEEYSNTIRETGCIITIYGPAQTPIIYLNGYEMKYDNVILDGNKLIIDTGNSTVTHVTSKDVRTNAAIYYNHEYPKIQNGINKIEIKSGIGYDKQVITEWYDLKL